MEYLYKEVMFGDYCKKCQYEKDSEWDEESPCYDCMFEGKNEQSHMPVNFKQKDIIKT